MAKLNDQYLAYLIKYPLLTKSVTAGILAAFNESIASIITKDFKINKFKILGIDKTITIKHFLSTKILTMIIYGSLIVTPISHNLYSIINKIFKGPNLSKKAKFLQILTSLSTVTPILSGVFVSWLSIINNYKLPSTINTIDCKIEFGKIFRIIKSGLGENYFTILKSSILTSLSSLIIAQNFIKPELWVVFFNFVYFIIGTLQNIKIKKAQRKIVDDKSDDLINDDDKLKSD